MLLMGVHRSCRCRLRKLERAMTLERQTYRTSQRNMSPCQCQRQYVSDTIIAMPRLNGSGARWGRLS
jgi:hypothetical protein